MGKKGRNRHLIEMRNRKIVERYYYWTEVRRLRFDDAVKQLSENEFFLSEFVIWQILKKVSVPGLGAPPPRPGHTPKGSQPKGGESLTLFEGE